MATPTLSYPAVTLVTARSGSLVVQQVPLVDFAAANPSRTPQITVPTDLTKTVFYGPGLPITPKFQLYIFDTSDKLVMCIQDSLSGSFEDDVNGGSGQGSFVVPRHFVDVGWVNYNYRVQLYLQDSLDPWYDGYVIEIDQAQQDSIGDRDTVTVQTDGWQTWMNRYVVTEQLATGVQSNGQDFGIEYADTYLNHLLDTYLDSSHISKSFVSSVGFGLDPLNFDHQGLADCINQVVQQVTDETGNIYEWWVRGTANGLPGVVIQPQQNPAKVSAGYYTPTKQQPARYYAEFKDATIYAYSIQNSAQNIVNQIAMYGGQDPTTGLQIFSAFQDSTSISLYGVVQKKVTNSTCVSPGSLENYATAYLLQNAYPIPQGYYKKFCATDFMRSGQWVQIMEPGIQNTGESFIGINASNLNELYTYHPGNVKQVRAVRVVVSWGASGQGDRVEQEVYTTAPRPFIDGGYYGAINAARGAQATQTLTKGSAQLVNYFLKQGLDYVSSTNGSPPTVTVTPPSGYFNSNTLTSVSETGNITVSLQDGVSGESGPGVYTTCFVDNELAVFGSGADGPAVHVVKGVPPASNHILVGHRFTVQ